MRKILERCPGCGSDLYAARLDCPACGIVILGKFEPCPFCQLSPQDMQFVTTFIKCRGNVREMERELGISYWTMRRMLDDLIQKLGLEAEPGPDLDREAQMRTILEQLDRGEISASEATAMLSRLRE